MVTVFIKILNMSISAGLLALVVTLLRVPLRKAPKWITCLLWGLVALRLVMPFTLNSPISLMPSAEVIPEEILDTGVPRIESGIGVIDRTVNPIIAELGQTVRQEGQQDLPTQQNLPEQKGQEGQTQQTEDVKGNEMPQVEPNEQNSEPEQTKIGVGTVKKLFTVLGIVWLSGVILMLLYAFVSYLRVRRTVREACIIEKRILICDELPSAFILGMIKPKVYLPSELESENRAYVVAHEKAHIARKDHLWKPLGYLLLSVYWFNPLLWVAYILLCRDIEMACDEKVIAQMGQEHKKSYSTALLECSVRRRVITACPLAFGEVGVKTRVKKVLNYKKPAFRIIVAALILCVAAAVFFLTSPLREEPAEPTTEEPTTEEPTTEEPTQTPEGLEVVFDNELEGYVIVGRGSNTDKDLVIPAEYDGKPVVSVGEKAFRNCADLTSVEIPKGIKSIGGFAFNNCGALCRVTLPDGLTEIDRSAFYKCGSLKEIGIPKSITRIAANAFNGCAIERVDITDFAAWCEIDFVDAKAKPGGSLYLNGTLMEKTNKLVIPDGVTKIGDYVFSDYDIRSLVIPESVTSIGNYSFYACNLISLVIPEGVTSIGNCAFERCGKLIEVTIPESMKSIGNFAFDRCGNLADVYYPGGVADWGKISIGQDNNPLEYQAEKHFDYNADAKKEELYYLLTTDGTSYVVAGIGTYGDAELIIPKEYNRKPVSTIGYKAFEGCTDITSAVIPEGVTEIGESAFSGCTGLSSAEISESVKSIGNAVFDGCSNLQTIYCRAERQPVGWDSEWNKGCSANIVWGYKD